MYKNHKIGIVIPTYKSIDHIQSVIDGLPLWIDHIIIIDDKCPLHTGKSVQENYQYDIRILVLFHEVNQGVGGATVTGYKKAVETGCHIVVKMDSDNQMDPDYLELLIEPLVSRSAEYTKGNRFVDFKALKSMPLGRLLGNSVLSFMVKASSGYWNMMDPTNGYTAISSSALSKINLDKLEKRYFFESDMLIHLNIYNIILANVPIPARYGDEISSLNIWTTMIKFPPKLIRGIMKRFFYKYLIYDFNMASVYVLIGLPLFIWGVVFGLVKWIHNASIMVETTTGTVMLSVLPLILGTQFLLAAINIDIDSTPGKK
ncbi:MAG: glycosyl transferase family 2 [Bacteroidetes bacterium HGW-Bacteroidetes-16]|jgi:glycosyltransferase involved in cell wall biosynthesis|nr:MAG: glycosyl transferase family 2 [Bacteroidetes bacterium HGW-Bacteroidetes-16]